jgi:hypothetical protein
MPAITVVMTTRVIPTSCRYPKVHANNKTPCQDLEEEVVVDLDNRLPLVPLLPVLEIVGALVAATTTVNKVSLHRSVRRHLHQLLA